ncbi:MAG: T9SS type A sorting domain-containing protein [Chitinophagaceae bacterium]
MRKFFINVIAVILLFNAKAQTPVNIASQPNFTYTENFNDIANWTFRVSPAADGTFTSGIGASAFRGNDVNTSGFIPSATRITTASYTFQTPPSGSQGYSGGIYKGTGNLIFLSTGTSDNTSSISMDLYLNFAGVNAGTLSFDWATLNNGTGNRNASFKVYATVDGSNFTELIAAQVTNFTNNVLTNGTVSNITLPSSFNNNANARLRFYYHNGSGGTSGGRPRFSIDNIRVTGLSTLPCVAPTAQPTSLSISNITNVAMQLNFTQASPTPQNYLVIMSLNAGLTSNPVNGTNYAVNDNVGDGTVIAITNSNMINVTNLTASKSYYFFIFSVNNACTGGPLYLTTNPLTNWATTLSGPVACTAPSPQATNLVFSNITTSSITGTFTKSTSINADEYLIIRSTASTFTGTLNSGSNYNGGQLIGNGSVVTRTTNNTFTANNLANGTTYYFYVFAVNSQNCNGGPVYATANALTGNATTVSLPTCVTPTNQATQLNLQATNNLVTGYFTPSSSADGYLILRSTASTLIDLPINNVDYSIGSTLGSATIISNSTRTGFLDANLTPSTNYYYYCVAKNSTCNGGTKYLTPTPLQASVTTTSLPTQNFYYGNLHAHSTYSDGNQDNSNLIPTDNYNYAKNSLCMDFLGISDHNHQTAGMNLPNYANGLAQATAATTSNFLALYGMEWGVISNGGHVLAYGTPGLVGWENGNYNVFVGKSNYLGKPEVTGNIGLFRYINSLNNKSFTTLAHPNFEDYQNLLNEPYDSNADSAIAGCAVASGVAFSTNTTYSDPPTSFGYIDYYTRILAKGYHIGPTMDHDSHNTNFGRANNNRTVLVMPSLSISNFYTAMQNNSFYASEDCDTKLYFSLNNNPMGSDNTGTLAPNIAAYIVDPTNPTGAVTLRLMHGIAGSNVLPVEIARSTTNTLNFTDFSLQNGSNAYYYIDATIATSTGTARTMSSPIWYTKNTVLPIQLKSFTGLIVSNNALINFEVANEQNILIYVIEKSYDGVNYNTMQSIINSNSKKYSITDYDFKDGVNFYRLKTIYQSGKFEYSKVISLNNASSDFTLQVYPNPLKNYVNVSIKANQKNDTYLRIFDVYGKTVLSQKITIEKGKQSILIDLQKLPFGVYNIGCNIDGKTVNQKIIKQ